MLERIIIIVLYVCEFRGCLYLSSFDSSGQVLTRFAFDVTLHNVHLNNQRGSRPEYHRSNYGSTDWQTCSSEFPVVDKNGLVGMISGAEVKDIPREKWFETMVIDVCDRNFKTAYPDDDLQKTMDLMQKAGIGRVMIVDRDKPTRIVGVVSKTDIIIELERERIGAG
jgi:CBS domain-containing protein